MQGARAGRGGELDHWVRWGKGRWVPNGEQVNSKRKALISYVSKKLEATQFTCPWLPGPLSGGGVAGRLSLRLCLCSPLTWCTEMWTAPCVPSPFTPIYPLPGVTGVWLREELERSLELQELQSEGLRCEGASVLKDAWHPLVASPHCTPHWALPACKIILN